MLNLQPGVELRPEPSFALIQGEDIEVHCHLVQVSPHSCCILSLILYHTYQEQQ